MTEEPKKSLYEKVGEVAEDVKNAATATGKVVVTKTKEGVVAVEKAVETVRESETTKTIVQKSKDAVEYLEEKATQAVDYVMGKSPKDDDQGPDDSRKQ